MIPVEYRLEVWNNDRSSNLGIIPRSIIVSGSFSQEINGDYSLTVILDNDKRVNILDYILHRNHIFVNEILSSSTPRKFRIKTIKNSMSNSGGEQIEVFCEHITFDLIDEVMPVSIMYASVTLGGLKNKILTGSSFTNGTDSTNLTTYVIDSFTIGGRNRLDQLKELANKVNGYLVVNDDLSVQILSKPNVPTTTPVAVFSPRSKNLFSFTNELDSRRLVTKMYGVGGGEPKLTLAKTWHPLENSYIPAANQVALRAYKIGLGSGCYTDITSGPHNGRKFYVISRYDSAYYGSTIYYKILSFTPEKDGPGSTDEIIIDNSGANPFSFPTSASGKTDFAIVYSDSSVNYLGPYVPVDYVENRTLYNQYGIIDGLTEQSDLDFTENLLFDPFFSKRSYVSGKHPTIQTLGSGTYLTPTGDSGPSYSENTDLTYVKNGIKSQQIDTTRYGQGCYVVIDPQFKSNLSEYFSIKAVIFVVYGSVRVECIENGADHLTALYRKNVFPPANTSDPVIINTTGFTEVTFNGIVNASAPPISSNTGIAICFFQVNADAQIGARFYIDSIQCEPLPYLSESYIEGTTRKLLWNQCYDALRNVKDIYKTYEIEGSDLYNEGKNKYWNFDPADVVNIKSDSFGLNVNLFCQKKEINLLDPSDIKLQLDSKPDGEMEKSSDLYLQLKAKDQQFAESTGRLVKNKLRINTGNKKTVVNTLDDTDNANVTQRATSYSQDNGYISGIIWAGPVNHGCMFLDSLTVPAGKKAIFVYSLTETYKFSTTSDSGEAADCSVETVLSNFSDADSFIKNDVAVSNVDDTGVPVLFTKVFVAQGYFSATTPDDNWHGTNKPSYDETNCFTKSIREGTYDNLTFFALAQKGTSGHFIGYAGTLILMLVPVSQSFIDIYDIATGDQSIVTRATTTNGVSHQLPANGSFKIGVYPYEEIIDVVGFRTSNANAFDPQQKFLATNDYCVYPHKIGEPITEYGQPLSGKFHERLKCLLTAPTIINPTVTVI